MIIFTVIEEKEIYKKINDKYKKSLNTNTKHSKLNKQIKVQTIF